MVPLQSIVLEDLTVDHLVSSAVARHWSCGIMWPKGGFGRDSGLSFPILPLHIVLRRVQAQELLHDVATGGAWGHYTLNFRS